MERKNVERKVWNRVQRISGHRVLIKREKVTKVSHNKFFQKSNEKCIDTVYNHKFSIEPHAVGGGLLEKNGSFSSWSKIIAYGKK